MMMMMMMITIDKQVKCDDVTDFMWEDMYKGQRELSTHGFELQGVAKDINDILKILKPFVKQNFQNI
jgi:hypothetical protein